MKPMYALHKDSEGKILGANSFKHDYDLRAWVGTLDLRHGDSITFGMTAERFEFVEVEPETPAFIATSSSTPAATADEEQPF